jgi:F420-0:gamma-glutamyl ligase-like protein
MNFNELPEFQKELKRLSKKYKSLPDDLQEFCNVVTIVPLGNSKHFNIITQTGLFCIIKARLFCRYLKGTSLRIVYSYFEREQRIEFIELYFKGDKENEDRERIKEYLRNHQN